MKVIHIIKNSREYNKTAEEAFSNVEPIVMYKADSTLLKDGKPLFLPDYMGHISAGFHWVARISRLGKSIPQRFACRYYDSITLGLDIQADEEIERLKALEMPWDGAVNFDGASVIGNFINVCDINIENSNGQLMVDGVLTSENSIAQWKWSIEALIEKISKSVTLREGDLLYLGRVGERIPLKINQHILAELDGRKLLEFNVK